MQIRRYKPLVCAIGLVLGLLCVAEASKVNKHKPWIETTYHGIVTENDDKVLLDPPLIALDKDAPLRYAAFMGAVRNAASPFPALGPGIHARPGCLTPGQCWNVGTPEQFSYWGILYICCTLQSNLL
uniref:Uncharacterized protein n=1 Tax=Electrophorus electricus TaxID=8005 RepID=A0A4W4HA28_ELEEL